MTLCMYVGLILKKILHFLTFTQFARSTIWHKNEHKSVTKHQQILEVSIGLQVKYLPLDLDL